MGISKVTRGYQITIPRDVRGEANIDIGDVVLLASEGDIIKMRKATSDIVKKSFGIWKARDSVKFVRKLRSESEKRLARFKI